MQIIKRNEFKIDVFFDEWADGNEDAHECIMVISSEEYFTRDELIEIAEAHGGYWRENRGIIRSWYETV